MKVSRAGIFFGAILICIGVFLLLTVIGILKFGTLIGFFLAYNFLFHQLTNYAVDSQLAKLISILLGLLIWYGAVRVFKKNSKAGIAVVVALLVLQSGFLFFVGRNRYFDPQTGQPSKYYTLDPITGKYQLFDRQIFDRFGQQAAIVTPDIARKIERERNPPKVKNNEVTIDKIDRFFDPESGQPLVFYAKCSGLYHLYLKPGFDALTGSQLIPVDTESAEAIRNSTTMLPQHREITFYIHGDSGNLKVAEWFTGEFEIINHYKVVDRGIIAAGRGKLNWWRSGEEIFVRYKKTDGVYLATKGFLLGDDNFISIIFSEMKRKFAPVKDTTIFPIYVSGVFNQHFDLCGWMYNRGYEFFGFESACSDDNEGRRVIRSITIWYWSRVPIKCKTLSVSDDEKNLVFDRDFVMDLNYGDELEPRSFNSDLNPSFCTWGGKTVSVLLQIVVNHVDNRNVQMTLYPYEKVGEFVWITN